MASFRSCVSPGCKIRLPDLKYDSHSKCSVCVGHVCTIDNKCEECCLWPVDKFNIFLKHRKRLLADRERKARNRRLLKERKQDGFYDKTEDRLTIVDKAGGKAGKAGKVGNVRTVHSVSASVHSSSSSSGNKPLLHIDDVSDNLFSSPVSTIHSMSFARSLPYSLSRSATPSLAPRSDHDITVNAETLASLVRNVDFLMKERQLSLLHSASVSPAHLASSSMPVRDDGEDPQMSGALPRGPASHGERSLSGVCPSDSSPSPDRSRRRRRDPKDHGHKIKRSRRGSSEEPSAARPSLQEPQTYAHSEELQVPLDLPRDSSVSSVDSIQGNSPIDLSGNVPLDLSGNDP